MNLNYATQPRPESRCTKHKYPTEISHVKEPKQLQRPITLSKNVIEEIGFQIP